MKSPKKYIVLLFLGFATIFLSGCESTEINRSFVKYAEMRLKMGEPVMAYSFIEDVLIHGSDNARKDARNLYESSSELRAGAIESFSANRISSSTHTTQVGRLRIFERIASPSDYETASKMVNDFFAAQTAANLAIMERREAENLAIIEKRNAENLAIQQKKKADLEQALIINLKYKNDAFYVCRSKLDCDKSFSLVQIFILRNSEMKIQTANDVVIETYNPSGSHGIGMSAIKMPGAGQSATIFISVKCSHDMSDHELALICLNKSSLIYKNFPVFMAENFKN